MKSRSTKMKVVLAVPCAPLCPLWLRISSALLTIAVVSTVACAKGTTTSAAPVSASSKSEPRSATSAPPQPSAPDSAPLPHIDSKRAFQYTREAPPFGPRYIATENPNNLQHPLPHPLQPDLLNPNQS